MTAINVIISNRAAHLITDGAVTDPSGKLLMLMGKTQTFPHLRSAIAVRGSKNLIPAIVDFAGSLGRSYDEVRDCAASKMRELAATYEATLVGMYGPQVTQYDFVMAGWSKEHNRPSAFAVVSHDGHPGLSAWSQFDLGEYMLAPTSPGLVAEFERPLSEYVKDHAEGEAREGRESLGELARRIVERQRDILTIVTPEVGPVRNVGGYAQITTITRDTITSHILVRWNDLIGEKIGATTATNARSVPLGDWMGSVPRSASLR
jgi:hypothetical protein